MTGLSSETYILYNKIIIWGRNVLVQNIRGETSWSETSGSETSRSKKPSGEMSCVRNVQVPKVRGKMSRSKISRGETSWSKKTGSETSWTKNVSWRNDMVRNVRERNINVQNVRGWNILVQNVRGLNVQVQNVRGLKRPVQNVRDRNVRVRKHFLSLHFMIVKLPLWLWHSLRLLYDFEVLLFIIIQIWFMTRYLFWLNSGKYDHKISFGNDILTTINFDYKLPSPWPWRSSHGWGWHWENLWIHQTIYESDPSKGLEIMRCSNKVPKSVTHDVTRGRKPGAVARSEECPLGMQAAPISITTSGTFFREDLVMK